MTRNYPDNPWYPAGGSRVEPDELPRMSIDRLSEVLTDACRSAAAEVVHSHQFDLADELVAHLSGDAREAVTPALVDRMSKDVRRKLEQLATRQGYVLE